MNNRSDWEKRAEVNLRILLKAIRLQSLLVAQGNTPNMIIKTAVPNTDVFTSHDELTIHSLDKMGGVLYVRARNGHDEGDLVAILLGDMGPIQFVNPNLQKRMIAEMKDSMDYL
ncbi:MAG: hypothetical protein AAB965_00995 [Patescibacteria group bacterium]